MDQVSHNDLPTHVAVIMDGNGRWAQNRGMKRIEGHRAGSESVQAITRSCREKGLNYLTLYAFSSENWQRPRGEVQGLMQLMNRYLKNELQIMLENGIRFKALGDIHRLPKTTKKLLTETERQTAGNKDMVLSLALSYGGRQEILRACRHIAEACLAGELKPEDLDQNIFSRYLYTADLPDPDLLIRTGGDIRVSNFLLWQIAYTEIFVTPTYWPDFRETQLEEALEDYRKRQRRFGRTGEQVLLGRKGNPEAAW